VDADERLPLVADEVGDVEVAATPGTVHLPCVLVSRTGESVVTFQYRFIPRGRYTRTA
jgi:hypothetical protein